MENLNAEQTKKALECCTRGRKSKEDRPCLDCPYNECNIVGGTGERQIKGTCQGWLMKDALALINKLTEENERLKSVEYTCEFIKPHKVLECPIFDEILRTKTDTVREMQEGANEN